MKDLEEIKAELTSKVSNSADKHLLEYILQLFAENSPIELHPRILESIELGKQDIKEGRYFTLEEFMARTETWKRRRY